MADVLFVTFNATQIRISFLQAKAHTKANPFPITLGNAEQAVLLALRPHIIDLHGSSVTWLPKEVRATALLPSVGSFGIFFDAPIIGGGGTAAVEFAYCSADLLVPLRRTIGPKYVKGVFTRAPSLQKKTFGALLETRRC